MKNLYIQTKISQPQLASSIGEFLDSLPAVKRLDGKSGAGHGKMNPEIVIMDEYAKNGSIYEALESCKNELPDTAIFLISDNNTVEHAVSTVKAGASEYFYLPVDFESLRKSIEKVRTTSLAAGRKQGAAMYGFISSKGGLGATVLAVNTAVAMAAENKSEVALCDLSLQSGDGAVFLDLVPQTTIADLARNFHRLDDSFIRNAMVSHSSGLEFLAAPGAADEEYGIEAAKIEGIINKLRRLYRMIVVDCPSTMVTEESLRVLSFCEKIFIVLDLSLPAISNAARLFKKLSRTGIDETQLEFVVNRFTKNSAISLKEADKNLGKPVFWVCPNSYKEIFSSITGGSPLVQSQPKSKFAGNIKEFVKKVKAPESGKNYRGINKRFGRLIF